MAGLYKLDKRSMYKANEKNSNDSKYVTDILNNQQNCDIMEETETKNRPGQKRKYHEY
jgi:hypothetical protein